MAKSVFTTGEKPDVGGSNKRGTFSETVFPHLGQPKLLHPRTCTKERSYSIQNAKRRSQNFHKISPANWVTRLPPPLSKFLQLGELLTL